MSVQVEKLEKNMAKLTIEVAAEKFEAAVEEAYQKEKKNISIQGFRKGAAPRKMIEQMYGATVFYDSAINALIPDAFDEAAATCGEEVVSYPEVDVIQAEAGKPFIFTAVVAIKPEVKLGEYKGIQVSASDVTVTDEDIEEEIKRQQNMQARTVEVTDRAVQDGDQAVIDFEGFLDGVAFEGGKGTDYPLTIGSHTFIPGFEEALIGAEIGADVDVNVTFPEDYQAEELAGKPVVFKCKVKSITARELPEVDDELASDAGFDSVAEWKESIRSDIEVRKISEAKSDKEDAVIEALVEASEMEIPDAMLQTECRSMVNDFARQITSQGMSFEQYMQYTGATLEKLLEQVAPQAERRIKSRLVLEAVADAESIVVSDEELDSELGVMAQAYNIELDEVKSTLGETGAEQVRKDVRIKKALELITENAKEDK